MDEEEDKTLIGFSVVVDVVLLVVGFLVVVVVVLLGAGVDARTGLLLMLEEEIVVC